MGSVHIRDVRKTFGAVAVLHGVSVDIADGEFLVLVGPSGCGKSTLLRMVAGLEGVDGGEIEIAGRVVNEVEAKDRDIAMVFQSYALYPHMTVAENMSFALRLRGVAKDEIKARVARAAGILGLTDYLSRSPRQLSGGQRQRVAMGRAIVRDPQVFLFDEPLSNLDAQLRVQMRSEIKELHERLGTTTVYVTHDQLEAMTLADRIVVMRAGRIEQIASPLELYDRPATAFVAGFIGSPAMNVFRGRIAAGETPALEIAGQGQLPLPAGALIHAGREVLVGIRPEHLALDGAGLPAEVVLVEPTGAETHVTLRLFGQNTVCVFRERLGVTRGETLHIRPAADRLHLFDAATGGRLELATG